MSHPCRPPPLSPDRTSKPRSLPSIIACQKRHSLHAKSPLSLMRLQLIPLPLYHKPLPLFVNVVKLLAQYFVHRKHVNPILLKHQLHLIIATDLALVGGVLQITSFDVLPYLLNDLGSGELCLHVSKDVRNNSRRNLP